MLLDQEKTNGAFCPWEEDDSLCAQLYRSYASAILAYLKRHVPTQEDAEDLLLEVFLAALEYETHLGELSEDHQRAWLGTVARNKMRDLHRRTRRRPSLPLETIQSTPDDERTIPENQVLYAEEHANLRTYMQLLSTTQQEVLQLRFMLGLRCAEIAKTLNKREGAIRTMLSRSLNTLRDLYEQKEKTDGEL